MKRIVLDVQVKLCGRKNFRGEKKLIDYYITVPGRDRIYAFSQTFTYGTYDLCKSGVIVNELLSKRSRDRGIMNLVRKMQVMAAYLQEEYELPLAS